MVPHHGDFWGKSAKNIRAFYIHQARYPVHRPGRLYYFAAKNVNNTLVAETNAQNRDFTGIFFYHFCANAKIFFACRRARARRNNYVRWF